MPESDLVGSRYEVLRTISEGPRASVLQALDHVHDRLVALKVYPVTDDDRGELLSEAQLLMSMSPHPALPVVRGDFFTEDQDCYVLVMNWVEGSDLQRLLEEQGDPGLPIEDVIDVVADVAGALDHLHAHDPPIIHGDVKPANLVRTSAGRVVLVDFDIAGRNGGKGRIGTIGYVAPEVAAGEKPGPEADVYGLAATAIALLSGSPPTEVGPVSPSVDPTDQGHIARVLRSALATDPTRRPSAAGRLVENLRTAHRPDYPSGFVALLAAEVVDAARLWDEDPDEMRAAMMRLRDVRDEEFELRGGRVVTSMSEDDRMIAVFRGASDAARAAVSLHDRLAREEFPPGFEIQLRAGAAVGEVALLDDVYTGDVVDHVLGLRSAARPGMTLTSEPTAELLVGLVGQEVSIVPLGERAGAALTGGGGVFALTKPGDEQSVRTTPSAADVAEVAALLESEPGIPPRRPRRALVVHRKLVADSLQHASTLVALTVVGLASIFLFVLTPEVGMRTPAVVILAISVVVCVATFAARYSLANAELRRQIDEERRRLEFEAHEHEVERARADMRARLEQGLARLRSEDGRAAGQTLDGLDDEYQAIQNLVRRAMDRQSFSVSSMLPSLADETYRHGMSALSDALELLEFADGPQRRRIDEELREVTDRLEQDAYPDTRARARDEHRRDKRDQLLARHDESRQHARDLVFEAERCTGALAEARIELASMRAGETQVDVNAVVATLQETIRRVREVQDELRKLGY